MRLALAPTLLELSQPKGLLLQRLINRLLEADARHREACRLENLPDERLRDMGLTKSTAARHVGLRGPWGCT